MAIHAQKGLTLFVVALLLTPSFAPVTTAASTSPGAQSTIETVEESVSTPPNSTAFELKIAAMERLNDTDLNDTEKQQLLAELNDTLPHFLDANRVTSEQVFRKDQKVGANLNKRAENVTDLLIESDALLARTAVNDAERVFKLLNDRGVKFDKAGVKEDIKAAKEKLQQAEHVREQDDEPTGAIEHYREAWEHAQEALDEMDTAVAPQVTITQRKDPAHDGSINYTVQGTVFDVRVHEIDNVTISVNGENKTVRLFANTTPGSTARFGINPHRPSSSSSIVTLEEQVNTIQVSAVEPAESDQKQSRDNEPQSGVAVLRLDGDRLPDVFEENATQTDPLDPDSNSTATKTNQADDGTRDDKEDLDGDRLTNFDEFRVGTDPLLTDTDGDDLRDRFELVVTGTDPLMADTDGDGTEDGKEDPDGDGLTNAREQEVGSDPNLADGDGDGLNDPAELEKGTDPLNPDTDDDFLEDGTEPQNPFNTDPLDPDTDGDGVLDGNETYTTTAKNAAVGGKVDVTGEGDVASGVSITNGSRTVFQNNATQNASVSKFVEFEADKTFEEANVTVSYDESKVPNGDEAGLAVYTFNESLQTFVRLNSTVDPANNTVTTSVKHFSTFAVFYVKNWNQVFEAELPEGRAENGDDEPVPLDIVFTMDSSGSMQFNDPDGFRKTAAKRFVGALLDIDRAGVVDFDHSSFVRQPLTGDFDQVNNSIDNLDASGGTDIGGGIATANNHFDAESNKSRAKVEILLTDGRNTFGSDAQTLQAARNAADRNITIHTIGFGNSDNVLLRKVANITNGTFNHVSDASDLPEVFERVANETTAEDTDDDGISDNIEKQGMRVGTGQIIQTDPTDNDTDGDGLEDGEEILVNEIKTNPDNNGNYFTMISDPTESDTDDDKLTDAVEVNGWDVHIDEEGGSAIRWNASSDTTMHVTSNPREPDTDNDRANDSVEKNALHTDPRVAVTYAITDRHQTNIIDALQQEDTRTGIFGFGLREGVVAARALGVLAQDETWSDLQAIQLNDSSDDFDFIRPSNGIVFTALDQTDRTDTWLSNAAELTEQTRPWVSDMDNDGLTDGQEVKWVTSADRGDIGSIRREDVNDQGLLDSDPSLDTDPRDPDSDEDGYWDGWIGVYGVDDTENVILYVEHLQGGIDRDEAVNEQLGVHTVEPGAPGADVDEDGTREHSNVHLGELHWNTDPTDSAVTPDPTVRLEIDHDENIRGVLNSEVWRENVSENYGIYGINVEFLTGDSHQDPIPTAGLIAATGRNDYNNGYNGTDLVEIQRVYHDNQNTRYTLVGTRVEDVRGNAVLFECQSGLAIRSRGVNGLFSGDPNDPGQEGVMCDLGQFVPGSPSRTEEIRTLALSVQVHEIGHLINAGEADESGREVYSGDPNDPTPENVVINGNLQAQWSVMNNGGSVQEYLPPGGNDYVPFSIEELLTANT